MEEIFSGRFPRTFPRNIETFQQIVSGICQRIVLRENFKDLTKKFYRDVNEATTPRGRGHNPRGRGHNPQGHNPRGQGRGRGRGQDPSRNSSYYYLTTPEIRFHYLTAGV